ncbi:MAG: hypothetical protein IIZ07_07320 [Ruminococcus sp.]|nr:hypothetical protein [Ruminococcus sp.]
MKDSKGIKKLAQGAAADLNLGSVSNEDLELINGYTRRSLGADEVFVFSVILCDNDVDRDGERFTVESLFALEKLFVGKTGIIDHNPSAKNQRARIFECRVEAVEGRKTATGDDYFRLRARAYMPVCEANRELMLAIDSGIVKEVSVGCAVEETVCSICGEKIGLCGHKKGEVYSGRLCCGELVAPYDAYEWSFVAVPAQRSAGVTKSWKGKGLDMDKLLEKIECRKGFLLGDEDCTKLKEYIDGLKQSAKDGIFYRDALTGEVLRLSAVVQPDISRETMEAVAKGMSVAQLREFKSAFEKTRSEKLGIPPQLCGDSGKQNVPDYGEFRI